MHNSNADDFHGKDGGCKRGAEKCCESGAHAAHDDGMAAVVIEMKQVAETVGNAAAKLKGSSFPSSRSSAQLGEDSGKEDGRCHLNGNLGRGLYGCDDHVGTRVVFIIEKPVEKDNGKTSQGQSQQKGRMGSTGGICPGKGQGETGSSSAYNHAGHQPEKDPFQKGRDVKKGCSSIGNTGGTEAVEKILM